MAGGPEDTPSVVVGCARDKLMMRHFFGTFERHSIRPDRYFAGWSLAGILKFDSKHKQMIAGIVDAVGNIYGGVANPRALKAA